MDSNPAEAKPARRTVTLRLSIDQHEQLKNAAHDRRISMEQLIRDAISQYVVPPVSTPVEVIGFAAVPPVSDAEPGTA